LAKDAISFIVKITSRFIHLEGLPEFSKNEINEFEKKALNFGESYKLTEIKNRMRKEGNYE
jgi:hypothetical protein